MDENKMYLSIDSLDSRDDLQTAIEEMKLALDDHVNPEKRRDAPDTLCLSLSQHEQTADPYASYSFEISFSYTTHRYVVTTTRSPQEVGSESTYESDFADARGAAGHIASFNVIKWFYQDLSPAQMHLLDAIDNDNPEKAKAALGEGADVDQSDIQGSPCLITAVKFRKKELVEALLEKGPNLEIADGDGNRALHWAVIKNRNDVFNLLVGRGADISAVNKEGDNGLMLAAAYSNHEVLLFFLNQGFDPVLRNKSGKDPLTMALQTGNDKAVRLLMDRGAVLKTDDAFLHFLKSCELGFLEMSELLADSGVPLDRPGYIIPELPDSDATGLMTAASLGRSRIVAMLIAKGAAVDVKNSLGRTALMMAAQGNHVKAVHLLLNAGAAIEAMDREGKSPLHHALESCALNAAGYLIRRGADPGKIKNRSPIMDEGISQMNEYREALDDNIRMALESSD